MKNQLNEIKAFMLCSFIRRHLLLKMLFRIGGHFVFVLTLSGLCLHGSHGFPRDQDSLGYPDGSLYTDLEPSNHQFGRLNLRTPDFLKPRKLWVDVGKEIEHWNQVEAKLNVELKSSPDFSESSDSRRLSGALKKDVEAANLLDRKVQRLNAEIQAERMPESDESLSFLQLNGHKASFLTGSEIVSSDVVTMSDWAYCLCESGPNGILVNSARNWPGIALPDPPKVDFNSPSASSFLQITLKGRRLAIRRADDCDCSDPWKEFSDSSGATTCSVNNNARVCLVRVNPTEGAKSSDELQEEAKELIEAIDNAFVPGMKTYSDSSVPQAPPVDRIRVTVSNITNGNGNSTTEVSNNGSASASLLESGGSVPINPFAWSPYRFQL
jgi:hypothetical protein